MDSLRRYDFATSSPTARRGGSLSPQKKDFFSTTMTTFSKRYKKQMNELYEYQKKMDERLAMPKSRVKLFKKL